VYKWLQKRPLLMPQIPWTVVDGLEIAKARTLCHIHHYSHDYITLSSWSSLHCKKEGEEWEEGIKRRGAAMSAPPSLAPVLGKKRSTGLPERKVGTHIEGIFSKILTFPDCVLQYDPCTSFFCQLSEMQKFLFLPLSTFFGCLAKPTGALECSHSHSQPSANAVKLWIPG